MELAREACAAALHDARSPDHAGNAQTAVPSITLDAVVRAVAAEERRILRRGRVPGKAAHGSRFIVGAVVAGEHHESVLVNLQITAQLQQVPHGIIHAGHHRGMAFRCRDGPLCPAAEAFLRVFFPLAVIGIGRVDKRIPGAARGRVNHLARHASPLHTALEPAARRIRAGGYAQARVRRRQRERQEERLFRLLGAVVNNPLLGAGGEQIRGVTVVQYIRQHFFILPDGVAVGVRIGVALFFGIMTVPRQVVVVAEEEIKPALGRPGCGGFRGAAALIAAADSPFAHQRCGIARALQHRGQCMRVFQSGVKVVVADNFCHALVHTAKQGGARRGAYRGCRVVALQHQSRLCHFGQSRHIDARRSLCLGRALLQVHIPPAQVIHQHQNDVRLRSRRHCAGAGECRARTY